MSFAWNKLIFELTDNAFKLSNLPSRFRSASYGIVSNTQAAEKVFTLVREYQTRKGNSFLITGDSGTGKTVLGACAIKQLIAAGRGWGFYVSFPDMLDYKMNEKQIHPEQSDTYWSECLNTDLLVIDDIGFEMFGAQSAVNLLLGVLRARDGELRSTILLSQLNPRGLLDKYGLVLIENFKTRTETIVL